ncbi:uncharacterized protein ARMOST_01636 [Armillaria ostoyae]|uniref:Uncharacterized protein n=1 Tax=Armillaria ostoyae TaxID=47428 RepID=A0A284QPJ5_ARMOS|nr:uncharacterized protein ARMOST_01636 [Armillaria ostoyae]
MLDSRWVRLVTSRVTHRDLTFRPKKLSLESEAVCDLFLGIVTELGQAIRYFHGTISPRDFPCGNAKGDDGALVKALQTLFTFIVIDYRRLARWRLDYVQGRSSVASICLHPAQSVAGGWRVGITKEIIQRSYLFRKLDQDYVQDLLEPPYAFIRRSRSFD